jgi:hypothetical protein
MAVASIDPFGGSDWIARSSRATTAAPIQQAVAALNGRRDRLGASSRKRDGTGSPVRD